MKRITAFLLICLLSPVVARSQAVKTDPPEEVKTETGQDATPARKSDGCSGFPEGNYSDCCIAHDREYDLGGTRAERRAADKRLYLCVRAKGHKYLSRMMWIAVRSVGFGYFSWGKSKEKK